MTARVHAHTPSDTTHQLQGRVYAPDDVPDASADAVRAFNQAVRADARVEVVHVPFRDGVALIRRRCAVGQGRARCWLPAGMPVSDTC